MTVFLEFYGLPGCGKSTVSHAVAEELRKLGKTVAEPSYDLDHRHSDHIRKIKKAGYLLVLLSKHPAVFRKLVKLMKDNGYQGKKGILQCSNIAYKLLAYNDKTDADYVVFDEGLIQSAISLADKAGKSIENEKLLYGLCKTRDKISIYIEVNAETALKRMETREKHDSRIEKIQNIEDRRIALEAIEDQCRIMCDTEKTVHIGPSIDLDGSIKKIMSELKEKVYADADFADS